MKIQYNDIYNFPKYNINRIISKKLSSSEINSVQTNSLDILANQNRAFIAFKGNVSETGNPQIKELTDEEFEEYKQKFEQKVKTLPQKQTLFVKNLKFNKYNIQLADKIISDERMYNLNNKPGYYTVRGAISTTDTLEEAQAKSQMIDKIFSDERLYNNKNFMNDAVRTIFSTENQEEYEARCLVIDKILSDEKLYGNENLMMYAGPIIQFSDYQEKAEARCLVTDKILSDEKLYNNERIKMSLGNILYGISSDEEAQAKCQIIDKILSDDRLYGNKNIMNEIYPIIDCTNHKKAAQVKIRMIDKLLSDERLYNNKNIIKNTGNIIEVTKLHENFQFKCKLIKLLFDDDKKLYENRNVMNHAGELLLNTNNYAQFMIAEKILSDENLYNNKKIMKNTETFIKHINSKDNMEIANVILSDKSLYENENILKNTVDIITSWSPYKELAREIYWSNEKINTDENLRHYAEAMSLEVDTLERFNIAKKILFDERLYTNKDVMRYASHIMDHIDYSEKEIDTETALDYVATGEIDIKQIMYMLSYTQENISLLQLKKLNEIVGMDKTVKFSPRDTLMAAKFVDVFDKKSINEIPVEYKHEFLRNLVAANTDLYTITDEIKPYFPLLPKNTEEYCSLLSSLARSMEIETNKLSDKQIKNFNNDLSLLAAELAKLTDEEFNNLEISQNYDKDTFIDDVRSVLKDIPKAERQKIFDIFGFEIRENNRAKTGFSLIGYPKKPQKNINSDFKKTVKIIGKYVNKFNEDNFVQCNNKETEILLNNIIKVLPELRPQIGKVQAGNTRNDGTRIGEGSHDFDIFKHSLKVMQKIVQSPEYNNLNDSDKKIILLAALLHDISKKEGYTDPVHAKESCFDAYYIAQKFNLTRDEEIKLNELIKHHEWLAYVNNFKNENDLTKRLKDTAYDLRHDNMLDMALIFTHADLNAVKKDNSFHDKTEGRGRKVIDYELRSFGESADIYARKMNNFINELKKSQPVLPVTPFPKASRINKAITKVYPDGSTNIKGIYKDKDGLIIIKYNEVGNEDWEKIGFPKGSISHGIKTKTQNGKEVDTGNIKFFAHGLEFPNQLSKFDAFSLVDSDVLLSVSYAERPESKYRFFRPQGILLNCDTQNVHGGGKTDSGSGYFKNIQKFKDNYILGGSNKEDRTYISKLIKDATGMNDEEYVQFVKENSNKPFSKIEPEELRIKIIDAFANINSNIRRGEREYNEMFITNPYPPMAVYAYNMDNNVKTPDPVEFLNRKIISRNRPADSGVNDSAVYERTKFLREYALERDIPFVFFGD